MPTQAPMQDNAHTSNVILWAARASRTPMCSPAAGPPPPSVIALFTIGSLPLISRVAYSDRVSELREEEEINRFWDHWKARWTSMFDAFSDLLIALDGVDTYRIHKMMA